MQIAELLQSHKRSMITVLSLAVSGTLLLTAFTSAQGGSQSGGEDGETVYRESTVERGDLTVGITESATASLKNHSLSFEINSEIEEVFVKAGQPVQAGDPIASISADSIQEELDSLRAEYQSAAVKLSDAQLSQQKGEISAQSTYNSTVTKSATAEDTYELTIEKLELAVEKAQREVENLEDEIEGYDTLLGFIKNKSGDYATYLNAKDAVEQQEDAVAAWKKALSNQDATETTSDSEEGTYMTLEDRVEREEKRLQYAQEDLEDITKELTRKYGVDFTDVYNVNEARDDAADKLADARTSLKEAEYNLKAQSLEAGNTLEDTASQAQVAGATYELELKSLENSVASQQLSLQSIQDNIDKQQAYLENTVVYAPCDGTVTAVNVDAGDTVQAGGTVATISDGEGVYVYISVAQDDITGVTLGQECTVTMDAFEEIAFDGIVDSITTTPARSATGSASYSVTIKLEGGDLSQVYEGMTGNATLITRQQKDVLYVTTRTVYQKDGGSYVKVKNSDGTIEEVKVVTGFSDGRNVEISEGLAEGQTVLIESQVQAQ